MVDESGLLKTNQGAVAIEGQEADQDQEADLVPETVDLEAGVVLVVGLEVRAEVNLVQDQGRHCQRAEVLLGQNHDLEVVQNHQKKILTKN